MLTLAGFRGLLVRVWKVWAPQEFCDEAGVPVTALPQEDLSVHEQTLDSQMRAFFRLTSFSHR